MSDGVFFRVKFFEERDYAREFQKGKLYMNTAKFFAELDDKGDGRTDRDEGLMATYPGPGVELTIGNHTIQLSEGEGVKYKEPSLLESHVLCMYEAGTRHTGLSWTDDEAIGEPLPPELFEQVRDSLLPPGDTSALGPWCAVVTGDRMNGRHFAEQIRDAAALRNFGMKAKRVTYYDPIIMRGRFPEGEELFHKPNTFTDQREYRVVLEGVPASDRLDTGAYIFDVGDLGHCVRVMRTHELMTTLEIATA